MSDEILRVLDPADPNRCQGILAEGQCPNQAEPGTNYCLACTNGGLSLKKEEIRSYQLTRAKDRRRFAELSGHHWWSVLLDTLYGLQIQYEEALNARTENVFDPHIAEASTKLAARIESISDKIAKYQLMANEMIGKKALELLMQSVIQIITHELRSSGLDTWEDVQQRIAARIIKELGELKNEDE